MNEELLDALEARRGIICTVGAGGKKSTLYRLAQGHPGRVGLTASAHTTFFPATLGLHEIIEEPAKLTAAVAACDAQKIGYATPSSRPGRHAGVPVEMIEHLHEFGGFDVTLVKADGARMRLLKAPAEHEPVLPRSTTTLVTVVSAAAIGRSFDESVVHRPDQAAAITRLKNGELIAPAHVARLLSSPDGLMKGAAGMRVVPLINMVDDEKTAQLARETAEIALDQTTRFDHVVLACMRRRESQVVAVITR